MKNHNEIYSCNPSYLQKNMKKRKSKDYNVTSDIIFIEKRINTKALNDPKVDNALISEIFDKDKKNYLNQRLINKIYTIIKIILRMKKFIPDNKFLRKTIYSSIADMKRSDGQAVLLKVVQTIVAVDKKLSLRTL